MQIEMTIKGLMVDPVTNMPIVVLRDKTEEHSLPIWVGVFEANAIALQIENVTPPRPMTHDLLRDVISNFDGVVEKVVISSLSESTFFAFICIRIGDQVSMVDSRPSDAIALALRVGAPIFAEEAVLGDAKKADLNPDKGDSERLSKWLENLDPDELGKYKM